MDKAEILRYLRTSSKVKDENLLGLIDECINEVNSVVSPKTIYRIFECSLTDESVTINGIPFYSIRLAKMIAGCDRVCLFAATLGTECDRMIRTYQSSRIAKSAVLQSVLSAKIEEVCDNLENELEQQGLALCPRFSPGYFDFDITAQRDIFSLLDITKRIGVTLTDTCQMIPTKSVTAIIGIKSTEIIGGQ